jgi:glutathione S-transferase
VPSENRQLYVDSQFASPYALSAFVALREKNLQFQTVTVDLARGENHAAAYSATSLTHRVPTLVDAGFSLSESSAIAEYVDETYPGTPLYPADPRDRARARQVQAWIRSDLLDIRRERSTEVVFYYAKAAPLSSQARLCADRFLTTVDRLIPIGADNLFGAWCIADVDLALMLMRLLRNGDPLPDRLAVYANHQWARGSVQQWIAQPRPPL